jgi:hypothetical protein
MHAVRKIGIKYQRLNFENMDNLPRFNETISSCIDSQPPNRYQYTSNIKDVQKIEKKKRQNALLVVLPNKKGRKLSRPFLFPEALLISEATEQSAAPRY